MTSSLLTPSFFKALDSLQITTKKRILAQGYGVHRSRSRGHGLEFSEYRHYEPGDSLRSIDWKVYGRTKKLYVKTYQEEQSLSVSLILDTSRSMQNEPEKWERARALVAGCGYVSIRHRDLVTLFAPPHSPLSGGTSLASLLHTLTTTADPACESFSFLASQVRAQLPSRRRNGVTIIVSDFFAPLEEIYALFETVRSRSLEVIILHLLGKGDRAPLERNIPSEVIDSETQMVLPIGNPHLALQELRTRLSDHVTSLSRHCWSHHMAYSIIEPTTSIEQVFSKNILTSGLLR